MNKVNYQKKLEILLGQIEKEENVPTLLLHSCCAPCSSYCLEYLSDYFEITVFYYNPNIYPAEEYWMRAKEQQDFIRRFPAKHPIRYEEGIYEPERFFEMARGYETCREGGERCFRCYEMRLRMAARQAKEDRLDYFGTTLTISPLKNAEKLNEIGFRMEQEEGVSYLASDFKKKNGYKRSTEISKEYGMYRQDYCGCIYSYEERHREDSSLNYHFLEEKNICS